MIRLLLKIHNKTGLKYLCKSERKDWMKYLGSGKYWRRYLKIYGKDISTELLFESENFEEFKKVALKESIKRNIVESKEYANLMIEDGSGGDYWSGKKRPKHSEKMSDKNNPQYGKIGSLSVS